jgi:glucose-6-phosphate 1-epimerase
MDRPNRPAALAATSGLPPQAQATTTHSDALVTATLPSGDSVEVLLHGATVTSWKSSSSSSSAPQENLWLSTAAKLDGSKPVRGGIPLVFPVFGSDPAHAATSKLPQHGFARNNKWEFLGKSTSEGDGEAEGNSVKLDFGLSAAGLGADWRAKWPYDFGLVYSVTLSKGSLTTSLVVSNEGEDAFECQALLHTYLRVKVRFLF